MIKLPNTIVLIITLLLLDWCQFPAMAQTQIPEELKNLNAQLQVLYRQGKYDEAISVAEKMLSITNQKYGPDHPETATTLNNLAELYIAKKRYTDAESLSNKTLKIYRKGLGLFYPNLNVVNGLRHLGEIYEKTGRPDKAEKLYLESDEMRKRITGSAIPGGVVEPLQPLKLMSFSKKGNMKPDEVIAYWNTWFENQANDNRSIVLETGNLYSLVLDLSRFAYFKDYSAGVGTSVQKEISDAFKRGDKKIRFTIRPILHGDYFSFGENQSSSLPLEVDLSKLKELDVAVTKEKEGKYDEFLAGKMQVRDFAREVQAGETKFILKAQNSGAATISISIWDKNGTIPLDHLTLSVRVIDPGASGPKRGPTSETFSLRGGMGTLLDVATDFASTGPLAADAAFYIFEPGPKHKSIVLFAAKGVKKDALSPDPPDEVEVHAWETESLISQYIDDRNEFGILQKIKDARMRSKNNQPYSYQEVAEELRKKIFSGYADKDKQQAAGAEKNFRYLVSQQKRASIAFVRMRNKEGLPVYLPLGILAAKSQHPILEKRIILVQPLPRERYPAAAHPVEAWTITIPQRLPELRPLCNDALSLLPSTFPKVYRDILGLRGFLKQDVPLLNSNPEGILLLAHHAGGNLWFTDKNERIITEDINRHFPLGSVAILSACSLAAAEGNNQAMLEKLNNNGIDAMIISPFPVDANYGAMFAIHLFEALDRAKASSKGLTMFELFETAGEKTTKYFMEKMGVNYEEMALEFLIAGDYRIFLAPK